MADVTGTPDESPADKLLLANPRYDLVRLNVLSSTQISARTSAIIDRLTANDNPPPPSSTTPAVPTPILRLSAKAKVGSKLVTIVDISKRQLASKGVKCYQYNALSSVLTRVPRNPTSSNGNNDQDDDADQDDAFETMGPADSGTKLRKIPVLTVYLSIVPIKELAATLG